MIPAEAGFVLHPAGTLQVSQRTIPLDLKIDKVGSQAPSDANLFALSVAGATLTKIRDLQEPFAPSQFRNFDDATKLSQPAFVPQDSGIELAGSGLAGHGYGDHPPAALRPHRRRQRVRAGAAPLLRTLAGHVHQFPCR